MTVGPTEAPSGAPSCPRTWQPLNFQLITWPRKLISSQLNGPAPHRCSTKAVLRSTGLACLDDWGYCATFVTDLWGVEEELSKNTPGKAHFFVTQIA